MEGHERLGAVAVGGGDGDGLALIGTVGGAERPRPCAVLRAGLRNFADRSRNGDYVGAWVGESAGDSGLGAFVYFDFPGVVVAGVAENDISLATGHVGKSGRRNAPN